MNDRPDIIVIGAGFAGLSCATALAEAGARVLVLEARPGLGGRATAFRDPQTGERIDNGQHVLAGCYDATLAFLRRIGSEGALHRPSGLRVPMVDQEGRYTVLDLPALPAPFHLLAGVLAWEALNWGERLSILRLGPTLRRLANGAGDGIAARGETVREWLARHGQSTRLCALLWEPLALATLNQSIDQAAARSFLAVIGRMLGSDAEASTLLLPAALLDTFYAEPARAFLVSRGSDVRTGSPARIALEGERVAGVVVRDVLLPAGGVVAAVPWFALGDLFAEPPASMATVLRNARDLCSSPIVTVNVWCDRDVMDEPLLGLPGRTFQWVFDKSRIVPGGLTHLSMVSSGAEDIVARANDELVAIALQELRAAVPRARGAVVRHAAVVRERRATFSLSPAMPPRPGTETPIRGLLLAGDWIETGLPATIESAVVSGHRAAQVALRLVHRLTAPTDGPQRHRDTEKDFRETKPEYQA